MNNNEFNISALKKSLLTLKECWNVYLEKKNETVMESIITDSCVKRFEYTIETAIKLMRKYLKLEYAIDDKELTVNNIFRFMVGYDMIKDWEAWRNYYAKRNDTAHEYNNIKAKNLMIIIPEFISDVEFLISSFDNILVEK